MSVRRPWVNLLADRWGKVLVEEALTPSAVMDEFYRTHPEWREEARLNSQFHRLLSGLHEAAIKALDTDPSLVTPGIVRYLLAALREWEDHICDY